MAIELVGSNKKQPAWFSACNGVAFFSYNGYLCDRGNISSTIESEMCWKNRNKVLLYIDDLRQKGIERVSVKDICIETKLTEKFVTFVLEDEFGDLDEY